MTCSDPTLLARANRARVAGAPSGRPDELTRLREERDLYFNLVSLGAETEVEPFLSRVLALLVRISGATHGYIELRDVRDEAGPIPSEGRLDSRTWWLARGCTEDQVADIRSLISNSIVAESIKTGETVVTTSARDDSRFCNRTSIQMRCIDAVLCAPLGEDDVIGAVYLQGRTPFTDADRARIELFARQVSPIGQRLIERRRHAREPGGMVSLRGRYRLDGLVGSSSALAAAVRLAMQVAPLDITVLLTGASGTGKSQLARLIHDNSARASGPFVELNCAALPDTLVESELFGARAGSHSEARRDTPGKVAAAEGGTLFLDEIADMPIAAQAKLLQLLQSRSYFPLGANRPERVDIRVLAATNADLSRAVAEHRFREDLLFRLDVMPIRLPSLAERRSDIVELAREICGRVAERNRLPACELSPAATRAITAAEWPGNVRQLSNMLEAAVVRAAIEGVSSIPPSLVFPHSDAGGPGNDAPTTFQDATRAFQRQFLLDALESTDWNVTATARRLDLARSHVYNLIHSFDLSRDGELGSGSACH